MTKCYRVSTPEQLMELDSFRKTGSTLNVARVWRSEQRRGKSTPWLFDVTFSTDGRERKAVVSRLVNGVRKPMAWLKYAPALEWCEGNLVRLSES